MDGLNKIQEFYSEKTGENKEIKTEEIKERRRKIPKINRIQEVCSKKNNDNKSEAIYSLDDHKIQVSEKDKKRKVDKFIRIFDNVQVKNDHSNLTTVIKIPTYLILCLLHILVKMILYFSIPKRYQTKSKQTNQTVRTSLSMNSTLIMNTNNQPEEKSIIATIRYKGVNDTQEDGIEDITTQSNENKLIKVEINTQEEEIKLITGTKLLTRALNPDLCVTTRCNKCKGCKTCSPLIDISTKALENMKKNEENKIIRSFLTIREYPNGQNDFMITLPATKDVKMETFKYSNKKGVIASNDRKLLKLTEEQRKDLWTEFTKMVNLGYIREVKKASDFLKQQLKSSNFLYYIACAPAFKSSSMSTSTRCAWAALLLNTILPTGFMKLDMTKTFRRFRMLPCAYAVDVRKYYNSIHLDPEDYTINRIIFRDNASNIGETREYYLSRLFYGIKPAGAITDECLKYIAIEANRECEDCIEDEVTDDETNVEENSILNSIRRIKMSQNKEEKNNTNIGNDNHHDFSYIDETDLNTDQQCNKDITYETTDEGTVKEDTIAYKIPLGKQDHNTGEETTNIKEGKETNKIKTKREDCKNIVHKFYKTIMRKYVDDILGSEWNEATIEELEAYTERKLSRYSFTTKGWTKNYKRVPEDDDHLNEYDEMGTCSYQWKPYPNDTIAPKKVILHNGRKFRGAIIQITDFYDEDEQGNKIRIKAPELKMKVFRNADEVSTKALQELFANTPRTLRSCLSKVMMLFEPCGLLSPLTIQTRAALSEIVKVTSNNFDQIVPKRLYQHLLKCLAESIKGMCWEFKRRPDGDKLKTRPKFKLLTFWDYAKAVNIASYIVTKTDENKQSCFLINGKAMLLKQTTPKGELTAFAMASTIHKELRDEFADLIDEDYIIGDSEISIYQALRSINANVYVNNRVKTIQENINVLEKTYHVTGGNNLADLGTRYGTSEDNSNFITHDMVGPDSIYQTGLPWFSDLKRAEKDGILTSANTLNNRTKRGSMEDQNIQEYQIILTKMSELEDSGDESEIDDDFREELIISNLQNNSIVGELGETNLPTIKECDEWETEENNISNNTEKKINNQTKDKENRNLRKSSSENQTIALEHYINSKNCQPMYPITHYKEDDRPNIFLAIRIKNDQILKKLEALHTSLKEQHPDMKKLIQSTQKAHVTILALRINLDQIEQVKEIITKTLNKNKLNSNKGKNLEIELRGIDTFNERVIYTKIESGANQLKKLNKCLLEAFKNKGYKPDHLFTPHLTIAKIKIGDKERHDLLPMGILKTHEEWKFGHETIETLQLLVMEKPTAKDGYFRSLADFNIQINDQENINRKVEEKIHWLKGINITLSTFETNEEKQESTKDYIKKVMGKYHESENASPEIEYLLEHGNDIVKENGDEQNNTLSENLKILNSVWKLTQTQGIVPIQHKWEQALSNSNRRNLDYDQQEIRDFHRSWDFMMGWIFYNLTSFNEEMEKIEDNVNKNEQQTIMHDKFDEKLRGKESTYKSIINIGQEIINRMIEIDKPPIKEMINELQDYWNKSKGLSLDNQNKIEERHRAYKITGKDNKTEKINRETRKPLTLTQAKNRKNDNSIMEKVLVEIRERYELPATNEKNNISNIFYVNEIRNEAFRPFNKNVAITRLVVRACEAFLKTINKTLSLLECYETIQDDITNESNREYLKQGKLNTIENTRAKRKETLKICNNLSGEEKRRITNTIINAEEFTLSHQELNCLKGKSIGADFLNRKQYYSHPRGRHTVRLISYLTNLSREASKTDNNVYYTKIWKTIIELLQVHTFQKKAITEMAEWVIQDITIILFKFNKSRNKQKLIQALHLLNKTKEEKEIDWLTGLENFFLSTNEELPIRKPLSETEVFDTETYINATRASTALYAIRIAAETNYFTSERKLKSHGILVEGTWYAKRRTSNYGYYDIDEETRRLLESRGLATNMIIQEAYSPTSWATIKMIHQLDQDEQLLSRTCLTAQPHHKGLPKMLTKVQKTKYIMLVTAITEIIISNCFECKLRNRRTETNQEGRLPAHTLEVNSRPYAATYIDMAGPLKALIHPRTTTTRNQPEITCHILVAVCSLTKHVTMILCNGTDTNSVSLALTGLMNRVGKPEVIIADSQSSFVKLKNEGKIVTSTKDSIIIENITINLVPTTGSGHLANGSVEQKINQLRKIIGNFDLRKTSIGFADLQSMLEIASGIINRTPIGLRRAQKRNEAITGHPIMDFLSPDDIIHPTNPTKPISLITIEKDINQYQLKNEKIIEFMNNMMTDYLLNLQNIADKNYDPDRKNMNVDDIVAFKTRDGPFHNYYQPWKMGIVNEVTASNLDGIVRTIKILYIARPGEEVEVNGEFKEITKGMKCITKRRVDSVIKLTSPYQEEINFRQNAENTQRWLKNLSYKRLEEDITKSNKEELIEREEPINKTFEDKERDTISDIEQDDQMNENVKVVDKENEEEKTNREEENNTNDRYFLRTKARFRPKHLLFIALLMICTNNVCLSYPLDKEKRQTRGELLIKTTDEIITNLNEIRISHDNARNTRGKFKKILELEQSMITKDRSILEFINRLSYLPEQLDQLSVAIHFMISKRMGNKEKLENLVEIESIKYINLIEDLMKTNRKRRSHREDNDLELILEEIQEKEIKTTQDNMSKIDKDLQKELLELTAMRIILGLESTKEVRRNKETWMTRMDNYIKRGSTGYIMDNIKTPSINRRTIYETDERIINKERTDQDNKTIEEPTTNNPITNKSTTWSWYSGKGYPTSTQSTTTTMPSVQSYNWLENTWFNNKVIPPVCSGYLAILNKMIKDIDKVRPTLQTIKTDIEGFNNEIQQEMQREEIDLENDVKINLIRQQTLLNIYEEKIEGIKNKTMKGFLNVIEGINIVSVMSINDINLIERTLQKGRKFVKNTLKGRIKIKQKRRKKRTIKDPGNEMLLLHTADQLGILPNSWSEGLNMWNKFGETKKQMENISLSGTELYKRLNEALNTQKSGLTFEQSLMESLEENDRERSIKRRTVTEGEPLVTKCFEDTDDNIIWNREDGKLMFNMEYTYEGNEVNIIQTGCEQEGLYHCGIKPTSNEGIWNITNLNKQWKRIKLNIICQNQKQKDVSPNIVITIEGKTIELHCPNIEESTTQSVQWIKKDGMKKQNIQTTRNPLIINKAVTTDSGMYSCKFTKDGKIREGQTILQVTKIPQNGGESKNHEQYGLLEAYDCSNKITKQESLDLTKLGNCNINDYKAYNNKEEVFIELLHHKTSQEIEVKTCKLNVKLYSAYCRPGNYLNLWLNVNWVSTNIGGNHGIDGFSQILEEQVNISEHTCKQAWETGVFKTDLGTQEINIQLNKIGQPIHTKSDIFMHNSKVSENFNCTPAYGWQGDGLIYRGQHNQSTKKRKHEVIKAQLDLEMSLKYALVDHEEDKLYIPSAGLELKISEMDHDYTIDNTNVGRIILKRDLISKNKCTQYKRIVSGQAELYEPMRQVDTQYENTIKTTTNAQQDTGGITKPIHKQHQTTIAQKTENTTSTISIITTENYNNIVTTIPINKTKPNTTIKTTKIRRKRQTNLINDDNIDYGPIYSIVMRDMKQKFEAKKLTMAQKKEAGKIIKKTQQILRDESLKVFDIKRGNKSEPQILNILTRYKSANNNTKEQKLSMKILDKDTQIRMIQRLTEVLELTHTDLGITNEELKIIKNRETFKTVKINNKITKTPTTQDPNYELVTMSTTVEIPKSTTKSSVLTPKLFTAITEMNNLLTTIEDMNNLHIQREVPDTDDDTKITTTPINPPISTTSSTTKSTNYENIKKKIDQEKMNKKRNKNKVTKKQNNKEINSKKTHPKKREVRDTDIPGFVKFTTELDGEIRIFGFQLLKTTKICNTICKETQYPNVKICIRSVELADQQIVENEDKQILQHLGSNSLSLLQAGLDKSISQIMLILCSINRKLYQQAMNDFETNGPKLLDPTNNGKGLKILVRGEQAIILKCPLVTAIPRGEKSNTCCRNFPIIVPQRDGTLKNRYLTPITRQVVPYCDPTPCSTVLPTLFKTMEGKSLCQTKGAIDNCKNPVILQPQNEIQGRLSLLKKSEQILSTVGGALPEQIHLYSIVTDTKIQAVNAIMGKITQTTVDCIEGTCTANTPDDNFRRGFAKATLPEDIFYFSFSKTFKALATIALILFWYEKGTGMLALAVTLYNCSKQEGTNLNDISCFGLCCNIFCSISAALNPLHPKAIDTSFKLENLDRRIKKIKKNQQNLMKEEQVELLPILRQPTMEENTEINNIKEQLKQLKKEMKIMKTNINKLSNKQSIKGSDNEIVNRIITEPIPSLFEKQTNDETTEQQKTVTFRKLEKSEKN